MKKSRINILLVGGGKGCQALLNMFHKNSKINVACVIDLNLNAPGVGLAKELGVLVEKDYKFFLSNNRLASKIDEIINVTGSNQVQEDLLQLKPEGVEVMGGNSAKLMWGLVEDLNSKIKEIHKINEFMTGREMRIIELKKEVNELREELRQSPKYGT
ncbi:MAG: hypothetical protein ABH859_07895 [Pseudomonadota bacterium]